MMAPSPKLPISPLVGEMPGRAEGGAVPPTCPNMKDPWQEGRRPMSPSFLPDITPTRGEIGSFAGGAN